MPEPTAETRATLIARTRKRFECASVRWQMLLFVAATAGIGLLASTIMLGLGLHVIWLRYVLAVALAYAAFLGLIRWWITLSGADGSAPGDPDGAAGGDVLDLAVNNTDAVNYFVQVPDVPSMLANADTADFKLPDIDLDLGDDDSGGIGVVILIGVIAVAVIGGIVAAGVMIWSAPIFFAEVFVDAGLSYGLYRRLRRGPEPSWLHDAVGRSWKPFLAVAVLLGAVGWAMHALAPDAVSVGGVLSAIQ